MNEKLKEYTAIVWKKNSNEPGVHEAFYAHNSEEAAAILEEKYGKEILVSLTDVEAAARPR
jgi:flagellar motor switch protein FliG